MVKIDLGVFGESKTKEKPTVEVGINVNVGNYIIGHTINKVTVENVYYGTSTTPFLQTNPTEATPIKGIVEKIEGCNIKINGEWFVIGKSLNNVVIDTIINNP